VETFDIRPSATLVDASIRDLKSILIEIKNKKNRSTFSHQCCDE